MMEDINTAQLGSHVKGPRQSLSQIAILHIPHSSRQVPVEERRAILLDDAALNDELLNMTDAYTDELFPPTPVEGARLVFPVSRLVCDVERFSSDEDEPMANAGWAPFILKLPWVMFLKRSRMQQIVKSVWIGGTGRTIRNWSAW